MPWYWDDPRSWAEQAEPHISIYEREVSADAEEELRSIMSGESVEEWKARQAQRAEEA